MLDRRPGAGQSRARSRGGGQAGPCLWGRDSLPSAETHRAQRARSEASRAGRLHSPSGGLGAFPASWVGLSDHGGLARAERTQLKGLSALNELAAQLGEAEVSRQVECRREPHMEGHTCTEVRCFRLLHLAPQVRVASHTHTPYTPLPGKGPKLSGFRLQLFLVRP